jgi:predicted PolB exonuclease-like 3'-5' exonuclease
MALLLGLPGKLGMSGEQVWDAHHEGRSMDIRNYCETDVINTYLVYLRFELMRGRLNSDEHDRECATVRAWLESAGKAHLAGFVEAWPVG